MRTMPGPRRCSASTATACSSRPWRLPAPWRACPGMLIVAQYGGLGFAGGFQFGLKALIAAIIGGIGSIPGALLGGFVRGLVRNPLVCLSAHRGARHGALCGPDRVPDLSARRIAGIAGSNTATRLTDARTRSRRPPWQITPSPSTTCRRAAGTIKGQVLRTPARARPAPVRAHRRDGLREAREHAADRLLQGARRGHEARKPRRRTSAAAASSPCRPATTPRRSPTMHGASASPPPSSCRRARPW